MQHKLKRLLALLLALGMLLTLLPVNALAAGPEEEAQPAAAAAEAPAPEAEPEAPAAEPEAPVPSAEPEAPAPEAEPEAPAPEPEAAAPAPDLPAEVVDSGDFGDDVYWQYSDDGTLYIYGTGAMRDTIEANIPWKNYRSTITALRVESGVTVLGTYAFRGCTALREVSLPDTITGIKNYAFTSCTSLEEITIPGSVTSFGSCTFQSCTSLRRVTLNDGLSTIGYLMFTGCSALEQITIPASVTNVGYMAFANCTSLSDVSFRGSAPSFGTDVFQHVTATVRYPALDPSWTADKLQNYGGSLSWIRACWLWVSGVGVTAENRADILGDGLASYDPDSHSLYLQQSSLSGVYNWTREEYGSSIGYSAVIYGSAELGDLHVYAPNGLQLTNVDSSGVVCGVALENGDLTLDGNFSIDSADESIYCFDGDLTVNGDLDLISRISVYGAAELNGHTVIDSSRSCVYALKDLTFNGDAELYASAGSGAFVGDGDLCFNGDLICNTAYGMECNHNVRFNGRAEITAANYYGVLAHEKIWVNSPLMDVSGSEAALVGKQGIVRSDGCEITLPEGGLISRVQMSFFDGKGIDWVYTVTGSDGSSAASHAVIRRLWYPLTVCGVQVREENKNDVLGDGKVSFDPETNTLILDDRPLTDGPWTIGYGYAIYAYEGMDLTVKDSSGVLRIDPVDLSANAKGIYCEGNLTVDCDLTTTLANATAELFAEDGVTVRGDCSDFRLKTVGDILITGDYTKLAEDDSDESALRGYNVTVYGDLRIESDTEESCVEAAWEPSNDRYGSIMVGGELYLRNTNPDYGWGMYAGGDISVGGGVDVECTATCIISHGGDVLINGSTRAVGTTEGPQPAGKYLWPYGNGTPIVSRNGDVFLGGPVYVSALDCVGVYAGNEINFFSGSAEVTSSEAAVLAAGGIVWPEEAELILPAGGSVNPITIYGNEFPAVTEADGTTPATHVILRTCYDLWVGGVQVTGDNLNDVLGNGRARYDPSSKELTIWNTELNALHEGFLIYAGEDFGDLTLSTYGTMELNSADGGGICVENGDLIVHGNLRGTVAERFLRTPHGMVEIHGSADLTSTASSAVSANDSLIVEGDLTIHAVDGGVGANWGISVSGDTELVCTGESSIGMLAFQGNIQLDGNLNCEVGGFALKSGGDVTVGANVSIAAEIGVYCAQTLHVPNGVWEIDADNLAIVALQGVELGENERIVLPEDGLVSSAEVPNLDGEPTDGWTVTGSDGTTPAQHVIIRPTVYELWVGGVRVTDENLNDVLGDGQIRFDPAANVLTVNSTELFGTYSWTVSYDWGYTESFSAVIYAGSLLGSLRIDAPNGLSLRSDSGCGVWVERGDLTVNGTLGGSVLDYFLRTPKGGITLNGSAEPCSTGSVSCVSSRGPVLVNGDLAVYANGYCGVDGYSSLTVTGDLYFDCPNGNGVSVSGDISVGGDVTGSACRWGLNGDNVSIGGNVNIWSVYANSKEPTREDIVYQMKIGIFAGNKIFVQGGTWEIGGGDAAMMAMEGIELADGVRIVEPEGGSVAQAYFHFPEGKNRGEEPAWTVVEADGSTVACDVLLRGVESYPLWVGGVQVTGDNAEDVLGDGTVSYDPVNCVLTVNRTSLSDVFTWTASTSTGIVEYSAVIYAEEALEELTVVMPNGLSVSNPNGYGVMVCGDLVLDGDFTAVCRERCVCSLGGDLTLMGGDTELTSQNDYALFIEGSVLSYGGLKLTSHGRGALFARSGLDAYSTLELSCDGAYGCGAWVPDGDLRVGGAVSCHSVRNGVQAGGTVKMMGGVTVVSSSGVGVLAGDKVVIRGETWDVTGGEYAVVGKQGIDYTDAYTIELPVGGSAAYLPVELDAELGPQPAWTIVESDGTTQATHAIIRLRLSTGFYLVGPNGWELADIRGEDLFSANPEVQGEYLLHTTLQEGDPVKVVAIQDGEFATWFPLNNGSAYVTDAVHAGSVTIYFKPGYDGAWSSFGGYFYIERNCRFDDVPYGFWCYDAVEWAAAEEITTGTTQTEFSPAKACTRAQIVTFLWRAMGTPTGSGNAQDFLDVRPNAYYYHAVRWASGEGVTVGTSAKAFSPNRPCTRAQAVTLLWRAMGSPAPTQSGMPFDDVPENAWYAAAVRWAWENGITLGTRSGSFSPDASCSRGEIVTFLYRALAQEN